MNHSNDTGHHLYYKCKKTFGHYDFDKTSHKRGKFSEIDWVYNIDNVNNEPITTFTVEVAKIYKFVAYRDTVFAFVQTYAIPASLFVLGMKCFFT